MNINEYEEPGNNVNVRHANLSLISPKLEYESNQLLQYCTVLYSTVLYSTVLYCSIG